LAAGIGAVIVAWLYAPQSMKVLMVSGICLLVALGLYVGGGRHFRCRDCGKTFSKETGACPDCGGRHVEPLLPR
jgi:predicted amidophosphoribosyltransferase